MAIQSPRRNVSEAERKLLILHLLQALEPSAAEPLWQFASGWALTDDYFAFRLTLHELTEGGQIAAGSHAMAGQLYVTDAGRESLRLFGDRLPASMRRTIAAHAEAFKSQQLHRRQVSAIYESAERGDYALLLRLTEGEVSTLRLRVRTKHRAVARDCQQRFGAAASAVLQMFYAPPTPARPDAPSGPDASAAALPPDERFAVEALSATEYLAHCRFPPADGAEIELWLLFPTAESATAFAEAARARQQEIAAALLRTLRTGKA